MSGVDAVLTDLLKQIAASFKYNLQVLPDTMLAATFLFSLLFQSIAMITLFVCLIVHVGVHKVFAGFLARNVEGVRRPSSAGKCTGTFPGSSYLRAAAMSSGNYDMTDSGWPSYYASFMGFLMAYFASLTFIYANELKASPQRRVLTQGGLVVAGIVLAMCVVYRLSSGCDDVIGIAVGLGIGGLLGAVLSHVLAYASDRSLTNMLSLPLLTSTAVDGRPLYVCAPAS